MTLVQVVMLAGTLGVVAVVASMHRSACRTSQRFARLLIRLAGTVYRPRRVELTGELAMLQSTPTVSGLDYAFGAFVGATVERVGSIRYGLRLHGISKSYGTHQAVVGIDLQILSGTITALLGGNGAGKSTLIQLLAGVERADDGVIVFDGVALDAHTDRSKVAVLQNDCGLFNDLTVAQNLCFSGNGRWLVRPREEVEHARWALAQVGATIDPMLPVRHLPRSDRIQVAFARALLDGCHLVVLDSPSAALPQSGNDRLFEAMSALRQRNVSVLFVSHRVDEAFAIADRVAVLHDGVLVHEERVADSSPEQVVSHILGPDSADPYCTDSVRRKSRPVTLHRHPEFAPGRRGATPS